MFLAKKYVPGVKCTHTQGRLFFLFKLINRASWVVWPLDLWIPLNSPSPSFCLSSSLCHVLSLDKNLRLLLPILLCHTHIHACAHTPLALVLLSLFAKVWLASNWCAVDARKKGRRQVDTRLGVNHCIPTYCFN